MMTDVLRFALGLKRPHGHEYALRAYLAGRLSPYGAASIDRHGNLWIKVGLGSQVLFTAHLDTVHRDAGKNRYHWKNGMITTIGDDCLGADDGAGCAILAHMASHSIPGTYLFTLGEEVGSVSAREIKRRELKKFTSCVAFDRKGYYDVVNRQAGHACASDTYTNALCSALMLNQKCATGTYTDNETFSDVIPEIVNVSVGYHNQHSANEWLDTIYLQELALAVLEVDWDALPIVRDPRGYSYRPGDCQRVDEQVYEYARLHPELKW